VPSPSSAPVALPSLDDLLAPLDATRIVRAQALGPNVRSGPAFEAFQESIEPGSVVFAPVTASGSYRLWTTCLGDSHLEIQTVGGGTSADVEIIPLTCDATVTARQINLGSGASLRVATAGGNDPTAWRVVLEAPERAPLHATELNAQPVAIEGSTELVRATSETATPNYGDLATGGGILSPVQFDGIPARDRYDVEVACAGPTPIEVSLGSTVADGSGTSDDGRILDNVATVVECDGETHVDAINLALPHGAQMFVTADARTVWQVVVRGQTPPVQLDWRSDGWQLVTGMGPDLNFKGTGTSMSNGLTGTNHEIRVVVSCLGRGGVDVTVRSVAGEERIATFQVACDASAPMTVRKRVHVSGSAYTVEAKPSGKMWIAVAVQEPEAATGP
jgi:hypothetical protein